MWVILPSSNRPGPSVSFPTRCSHPPANGEAVARPEEASPPSRNATVTKVRGITYTPKVLASFVAEKIVGASRVAVEGPNRDCAATTRVPLRVLDPAVGHGQLLVSLLEALSPEARRGIDVHGYDTDTPALDLATQKIRVRFPRCNICFKGADFLADAFGARSSDAACIYDLIIANPPYVRTQVLGRDRSRQLARRWNLTGRLDLYHAFLMGIAHVLAPGGVAGIIVSNRFMTTKTGATVRAFIERSFAIRGIWDLGDTKIFDAAVLPAVLLLGHKHDSIATSARFVSIYQTTESADHTVATPLDALRHHGTVGVDDGRTFRVRRGVLRQYRNNGDVWRIATPTSEAWLDRVSANTWATFGSLGKVRVGVKSCADRVFIRHDWDTLPIEERPELLRPLATHRVAQCYRPRVSTRPMRVLYPHTVTGGRRCAVDLAHYPRSAKYLQRHRDALQERKYLIESGRKWYELWVPQNPDAWQHRKLIFRDITAQPMFWMDIEGMVVNGDCYWWRPTDPRDEVLWLALAVGNSRFITKFYDYSFNNKLYAGRRRFMAQYVEKFPLPAPDSRAGQAIIKATRVLFDRMPSDGVQHFRDEIDRMISRAFGLPAEEIGR